MAATPLAASDTGQRWRSFPWIATLLRVLIALAPLAGAVAVSLWLGPRLFVPQGALQVVGWWLTLVTASAVTAWVIDRLARRILPLTVMLKMTLLFPDRAPSRFRVALRRSDLGRLRRVVDDADKGRADRGEVAGIILSLASALNDYDRKLRGHGERTRAYADMLAEELKVPQEGRDRLRWAALLHDIGKIEIPSEILGKSGPLTEADKAVVRRHPLMGMRLAAPLVPWLGEWARAIEDHHEWWDGSGYPRGLEGEEIALGARIVAVADSYDVMTSGRLYQRPKSPEAARREIARMAGVQFDPKVVRALMNVSLGRLRWAIGPLAWFGQIPFYLDRLGRDFVTVTSAAALTASAIVGGIVSLPSTEAAPAILAAVGERAVDTTLPSRDPQTGRGRLPAPATTGDSVSETTVGFEEGDRAVADASGPDDEAPEATPGTPPPSPTTPTTATTSPPTGPTTTLLPLKLGDDVATAREDEPVVIDVLTNDTPAGVSLRELASPPRSGTATVIGGAIRYSPAADYNGTDTFEYRACDGPSRCAVATVAVRVTPVNDPPRARDDSATTDEGVAVRIQVLANDSDVDGDELRVGSVDAPGNGTAVGDGSSVVYTPKTGFDGTDRFSYQACDPAGACARATVTVTVRDVPRPPNAVDDTAFYHPGGKKEGTVDVLANDTHPDGTALDSDSLRVTTPPSQGKIVSISGGTIRFLMNAGTTTPDSFQYRICDVKRLCDTATVTLIKKP